MITPAIKIVGLRTDFRIVQFRNLVLEWRDRDMQLAGYQPLREVCGRFDDDFQIDLVLAAQELAQCRYQREVWKAADRIDHSDTQIA